MKAWTVAGTARLPLRRQLNEKKTPTAMCMQGSKTMSVINRAIPVAPAMGRCHQPHKVETKKAVHHWPLSPG